MHDTDAPTTAASSSLERTVARARRQTLADVLHRSARRFPDKIAVLEAGVAEPRCRTFAQLEADANRIAHALNERGIGAGDRVVVQLPDPAELLPVLFGLTRVGAAAVLALPAHRRAEIGHFAERSEAVAYLGAVPEAAELAAAARAASPALRHALPGPELAGLAADPVELPDPDPSSVALLQLSGGSTGRPKLIPRTHDDYLYSVRASAEICGLDASSVYLCALPAAHNFPLSSPGTLGTLAAGGRVVWSPSPAPDVAFPLVERERVTITGLVPPLALVWLAAAAEGAADLSSLRVLQVGGAKLSPEVARRVRPELGCRLQQVFGMAEGLVCYTRADDPEEVVATTQGRPISPDDEIRVVDDADRPVPDGEPGHLLTRGPYTIRGYHRGEDPGAFTADGFYRTGDLVRRTPTGHLVVTGRAKDQVNRGGEKIAVDEVEEHLLAHPAVHDAVLVGVPDDHLGERTCAVLVPVPGASPTAAEIRAFVRGRGLAAYKIPDRVRLVDAFPVTGVGKTSRRQLRAAVAEQAGGR